MERTQQLTNEELSDSLASHIKQMLDLSDELNNLCERENALQTEISSLGKRKLAVQRELRDSKKLLEFCIDTRSDPTQTRLSNTDKELDTLLTVNSHKKTLMEGFDVTSNSNSDYYIKELLSRKL